MTLKSKLLATGFLAALVTLVSASALAAQEIPGEFLKVHSDTFGGNGFTSADRAKFEYEIRIQIKNAAINVCAGRDFSIDKPSFGINGGQRCLPWTDCSDVPKFFAMSGAATVFCKN